MSCYTQLCLSHGKDSNTLSVTIIIPSPPVSYFCLPKVSKMPSKGTSSL